MPMKFSWIVERDRDRVAEFATNHATADSKNCNGTGGLGALVPARPEPRGLGPEACLKATDSLSRPIRLGRR